MITQAYRFGFNGMELRTLSIQTSQTPSGKRQFEKVTGWVF